MARELNISLAIVDDLENFCCKKALWKPVIRNYTKMAMSSPLIFAIRAGLIYDQLSYGEINSDSKVKWTMNHTSRGPDVAKKKGFQNSRLG